MATITLPTPLRAYADKNKEVQISGDTVGDLLRELTQLYPPLERHLFSESGALRSFVNVYVNDEDIRYLAKDRTPVNESDLVSIIPSIAGG